MLKQLDGILWDWNGTLLDDAAHCVTVVDTMLRKRGWGTMELARYRDLFGFPVRDYYVAVGFDFAQESFEDLSVEFIDRYHVGAEALPLHAGVEATLAAVREAGCPQAILSASRQDYLEAGVAERGIGSYFQVLGGIGDIYAAGKVARGRSLLAELGWAPARTLMIGDTLHDAEVADALGVELLLFAEGHFSPARLATAGVPVLADFAEIQRLLVSGHFPPSRVTAV